MKKVLEVGDKIIDLLGNIGVIEAIHNGYDDEGYLFWAALVNYPDKNATFTLRRNEIKNILIDIDNSDIEEI